MLIPVIFILIFAAGLFLPWWVIAIICFGAAWWLAHSGSQAFWSSFITVFIAWVLLAMLKSVPNQHLLANRVAALFSLPGWLAIMAVTGVIGGLVSGFAGLSGYLLKKALVPEQAIVE